MVSFWPEDEGTAGGNACIGNQSHDIGDPPAFPLLQYNVGYSDWVDGLGFSSIGLVVYVRKTI